MDKSIIKDYISKNRDLYSREVINKQLILSGTTQEELDLIWSEMDSSNLQSNPAVVEVRDNLSSSIKHSPAPLIWGLLGFFVPILGFIFAIVAIISGSKASKIDKTNGYAKAGKILGWITIILYVFTGLFFVYSIYSFYSYMNKFVGDIEGDTLKMTIKVNDSISKTGIKMENITSEGILFIDNFDTEEQSISKIRIYENVFSEEPLCVDGPYELILGPQVYEIENCTLIKGSKVQVTLDREKGLTSSSVSVK